MKNAFILSFVLVVFCFACNKEKDSSNIISTSVDCPALLDALNIYNDDILKLEVDALTTDLTPVSVPTDALGHKQNLNTLVDRLNTECSALQASVYCYACIETYPLLSEIKIEFVQDGKNLSRIIDIYTPEDGILHTKRMHD